MKALVYTGVEELIYRDEKDPVETEGESILEVQASGICGSDMHAYHGKDERRVPPLILGHEVSGKIINGKFKDKIAVLNPLLTCGKCEYCSNKREHLCPNRVLLGMNRPYERQGGFAELITVPNTNIYDVPEKLKVTEAAVAEPTAVAYHAVLTGEKSLKKNINLKSYFFERFFLPARTISHSKLTPVSSNTLFLTISPKSSISLDNAFPLLIKKLQCFSETLAFPKTNPLQPASSINFQDFSFLGLILLIINLSELITSNKFKFCAKHFFAYF